MSDPQAHQQPSASQGCTRMEGQQNISPMAQHAPAAYFHGPKMDHVSRHICDPSVASESLSKSQPRVRHMEELERHLIESTSSLSPLLRNTYPGKALASDSGYGTTTEPGSNVTQDSAFSPMPDSWNEHRFATMRHIDLSGLLDLQSVPEIQANEQARGPDIEVVHTNDNLGSDPMVTAMRDTDRPKTTQFARVKIDQLLNGAPAEADADSAATFSNVDCGKGEHENVVVQTSPQMPADDVAPSFTTSGSMSAPDPALSAAGSDTSSSRISSQQTNQTFSSSSSTNASELSHNDVTEAVQIMDELKSMMRHERCSTVYHDRTDVAAGLAEVTGATDGTHRGEGSGQRQDAGTRDAAKNGKRRRTGTDTRYGAGNNNHDDGDDDHDDLDTRKHRCLDLVKELTPNMKTQMPCPITIMHGISGPGQYGTSLEHGCHGTNSTFSELLRRLTTVHNIYICQKCCIRIPLGADGRAETGRIRHEREGCQIRCIDQSCFQAQEEDLLDVAHVPSSRCNPAWASKSMSNVDVWRYIYALVHNTNDAPTPIFEPGPQHRHKSRTEKATESSNSSRIANAARDLQEEVCSFVDYAAALRCQIDILKQRADLLLAQHSQELERQQGIHRSANALSHEKYEGKITNLQLIIMELCDDPAVQAKLSRSLRIRIQNEAPAVLPVDVRTSPQALPPSPSSETILFANVDHVIAEAGQQAACTDLAADNVLDQHILMNSFVGVLPSGDLDFGQLDNLDPEDWTSMLVA